jgi:hypothetical protein
MRPPDLPEGVDARPAPMPLRRRLLVLAGILVVIALILLGTIPVTVVHTASVPFTPTLKPDGTQVATVYLIAPSTCSTATGNHTVEVSLAWSVESGQKILYFAVSGPSPSTILYWPNDTAGGSFHFYGYCVVYILAANATQPETVQVEGTWNYSYSATGPIL